MWTGTLAQNDVRVDLVHVGGEYVTAGAVKWDEYADDEVESGEYIRGHLKVRTTFFLNSRLHRCVLEGEVHANGDHWVASYSCASGIQNSPWQGTLTRN